MEVKVFYESFGGRDSAASWMVKQYKKYGNRIISSNFAEDPEHVIGYITVLDESEVTPEPPKKNPLINIK